MKIAVIPGDGTGPEVTDEALKVLAAVARKQGFEYQLTPYEFGGEYYLRRGEILPEGAVEDKYATVEPVGLHADHGQALVGSGEGKIVKALNSRVRYWLRYRDGSGWRIPGSRNYWSRKASRFCQRMGCF